MTDPVTIGAVAASALAMAAEAVLKGVVGEAAKNAYAALKDKIVAWTAGDVEALAKEPDSKGRQLIVAEKIDQQPEDDRAAVYALATALNDALLEYARGNPVGIDIGRLEAARVRLAAINVTQGTGFRADKVTTAGDFTTGPISVGPQSGKSER